MGRDARDDCGVAQRILAATLIKRMDLSFLVAGPGASLPGEGDAVTVYAPNATQIVRIRRVLSKSQPFQGIAVLTVLAEREPCGDDSGDKQSQL